MGSKRTKKAKQELELIPNKNTITNGKEEEQSPTDDANSRATQNEAPPPAVTLQFSDSEKATSPIAETPSGLNESSSSLLLPETSTTSSNSLPAVTDADTSSSALPEQSETSATTSTAAESLTAPSNHVHAPPPSASSISVTKPRAPAKRKRKNEGTEVVPKRFKKATPSKARARKPKAKSSFLPKIETPMDISPPPIMNGDISNMENHKVAPSPKVVTPAKITTKVSNSGKSPASAARRDSFNLTWPPEDVAQLIDRIERNIPERDVLAYKSRVEKLNWPNVAFNQYSGEECKSTWIMIQRRMRRFRLLEEILTDAREWLYPKPVPKVNSAKMNSVSKNNTAKGTMKAAIAVPLQPKRKRHPDTPRRPLSAYLLYYTETKRQITSSNPSVDKAGLGKLLADMYKALAPEKREEYEKIASANKQEYVQKLKVFYEQHPECKPLPRGAAGQQMAKAEVKLEVSSPVLSAALASPTTSGLLNPPPFFTKAGRPPRKAGRPVGSPTMKVAAPKGEKLPKKFQTPFGLYYEAELKNKDPGELRLHFREKCKAAYREMTDEMKVHWITLAEQDLQRYEEEVKAFKIRNPNIVIPEAAKHVLSKKEKFTKERVSGKPIRPPNSAYGLFSRDFLTSPEIKAVQPKERMTYIANKWKNFSEEEQNYYKNTLAQLAEQYRQDWQTYVATLPEDERKKIVAQSGKTAKKRPKVKSVSPKTGKPLGRPVTKIKPVKKKTGRKRPVRKPKPAAPKNKLVEPEQPPRSAAKYFAQVYKGTEDPTQAWKALSAEEKRKYEEELVKKKQAYIVEFEKYLKSLTKEQLEALSQSRQQQRNHEEESSCSSGSEEDEADDDEADDEDEEKEGENGHHSDTN